MCFANPTCSEFEQSLLPLEMGLLQASKYHYSVRGMKCLACPPFPILGLENERGLCGHLPKPTHFQDDEGRDRKYD